MAAFTAERAPGRSPAFRSDSASSDGFICWLLWKGIYPLQPPRQHRESFLSPAASDSVRDESRVTRLKGLGSLVEHEVPFGRNHTTLGTGLDVERGVFPLNLAVVEGDVLHRVFLAVSATAAEGGDEHVLE